MTESGVAGNPGWPRWLGLSALVVVLDQLTKWIVVSELALNERVPLLPVFSLVRWHNDGAAFSMLSGGGGWQRWFFVTLAVLFTGFIIYELRRLKPGEKFMACVYALILGGALGNMVDRLVHGHVVDFILVHYRDWYFPAFNVADIALTCGAAAWIGHLALASWRGRNATGETGG